MKACFRRNALRGWVANRFYYQRNIPRKDAAILSNCPVRDVRRIWIHSIFDHDGTIRRADPGNAGHGGSQELAPQTKAASKHGCDSVKRAGYRAIDLMEDHHLLPGVRFAVDAYVNFARTQPWPIAIASSLTELFAPDLMSARLAAFEKFYSWIDARGLDYFRRRVTQARRDSDEALGITLEYCNTPELQGEAVRALEFKCDVLWAILDAIHHGSYGNRRSSLKMRATPISGSAQPRLTNGVRLQTDSVTGKSVLLYPEGIIELNETAHEILSRCDGRTLDEHCSRALRRIRRRSRSACRRRARNVGRFASTKID